MGNNKALDGAHQVFFWAWAVTAFVLSVVLELAWDGLFDRFLGPVSPLLVIAVASLSGAASLRLLTSRGWSASGTGDVRNGLMWSLVAAAVFVCFAIAADSSSGFAEDMNVRWPSSLLFYPTMAFVAEVVLHVIPLAAITLLMRWRYDGIGADRRAWTAIGLVALAETVFQTVDAAVGANPALAWFVAPHLFAIGVFELVMFRRYGFVVMAAFRLIYYLFWHIVWGYIRLELLF